MVKAVAVDTPYHMLGLHTTSRAAISLHSRQFCNHFVVGNHWKTIIEMVFHDVDDEERRRNNPLKELFHLSFSTSFGGRSSTSWLLLKIFQVSENDEEPRTTMIATVVRRRSTVVAVAEIRLSGLRQMAVV